MYGEYVLLPQRTGNHLEPIGIGYCLECMQLRRFVGLIDLGVLTILIAAVVFPPREMYADTAVKGTADDRFALALAEARTISDPTDPVRLERFTFKLDDLGLKDWAVQAGVAGTATTKQSKEHWRALLAVSVSYIGRLEAKPALKWATDAYKACLAAIASDESSKMTGGESRLCPSWERVRMEIYKEHLQAGVEAGIDPKRNPRGFREAGEGKIRATRLGGGHDKEQQTPAPTPPPKP
jgi:hypothetical protein